MGGAPLDIRKTLGHRLGHLARYDGQGSQPRKPHSERWNSRTEKLASLAESDESKLPFLTK